VALAYAAANRYPIRLPRSTGTRAAPVRRLASRGGKRSRHGDHGPSGTREKAVTNRAVEPVREHGRPDRPREAAPSHPRASVRGGAPVAARSGVPSHFKKREARRPLTGHQRLRGDPIGRSSSHATRCAVLFPARLSTRLLAVFAGLCRVHRFVRRYTRSVSQIVFQRSCPRDRWHVFAGPRHVHHFVRRYTRSVSQILFQRSCPGDRWHVLAAPAQIDCFVRRRARRGAPYYFQRRGPRGR
jgi:hypothetical protein